MRKLVAFTTAGLLIGCAGQQAQEPLPKTASTMQCIYPTISPLAETKELQSKGGINISLAPNNFDCVRSYRTTSREVQPSPGESLQMAVATGGKSQLYRMMEITEEPVFRVNPEKVAFRIKINNQMPRVFRGAGTVVLYNFGGKNASIDAQDYAELTSIIVPPRTEAQVVIYGPTFRAIPDKATLGIFLYDVVTKTDNAGNVVEKQNFEWYYDYKLQAKTAEMEVKKARQWISLQELQQQRIQQQLQQQQRLQQQYK